LVAWSDGHGAARAASGFRRVFGQAPEGVWAAPGRVNLIGEHTDYNGGISLPIALPHRTYLAAAVAPDDTARFASAQAEADEVWQAALVDINPGSVTGWGTYAAGVTWALRQRGVAAPALTGYVDSCVPFGAGLSSSAALEAACVLPSQDLRAVAGPPLDRTLLVAACIAAENQIAGAPTGGMDQAAALQSAAGCALIVDTGLNSIELVPFDLAGAGLELLVIDSRAEHAHASGEYGARRRTCEQAAEVLGVPNLRQIRPDQLEAALDDLRKSKAFGSAEAAEVAVRRVRHVVTEIGRAEDFIAALQEGRMDALGPLFDASHASLRDDYEVSAPGLDLAARSARQAGALGARMTGGGFGGSAIALVQAGQARHVAEAVDQAFTAAGFGPPVFLLADAAGPAERII
jgi:galactokinase